MEKKALRAFSTLTLRLLSGNEAACLRDPEKALSSLLFSSLEKIMLISAKH